MPANIRVDDFFRYNLKYKSAGGEFTPKDAVIVYGVYDPLGSISDRQQTRAGIWDGSKIAGRITTLDGEIVLDVKEDLRFLTKGSKGEGLEPGKSRVQRYQSCVADSPKKQPLFDCSLALRQVVGNEVIYVLNTQVGERFGELTSYQDEGGTFVKKNVELPFRGVKLARTNGDTSTFVVGYDDNEVVLGELVNGELVNQTNLLGYDLDRAQMIKCLDVTDGIASIATFKDVTVIDPESQGIQGIIDLKQDGYLVGIAQTSRGLEVATGNSVMTFR